MAYVILNVMEFNKIGLALYDVAWLKWCDGKTSEKPRIDDYIIIDYETGDFQREGFVSTVDNVHYYGKTRKEVIASIEFDKIAKEIKKEISKNFKNTIN